MFRLE